MEYSRAIWKVKLSVSYKDTVLLYSLDGKTFLIKLEERGKLHTHMGVIEHDRVVGREYGDPIESSIGKVLYLLEPTTEDFIMKSARKTQIMYPKDIGLILIKAGIRSGARIIEMGSGSGGLAIALASAVAPSGKVYSYDRNMNFQANARKNVERAGLLEFIEYKIGDITEGFAERDVDVVILDIPTPWEGIEHARCSLKGGGRFVGFSPTYNQVERTAEALREADFINIESVEILHRYILARAGKTRPFTDMVGHTGFITFARKVQSIKPALDQVTRDQTT